MKGKNALNAVIRTPFVKASVRAVQTELAKAREQLQDNKRVRESREANQKNADAIFIWIPKTAGTSLWNQLTQIGGQHLLTVEEIAEERPRRGICTFGHISIRHLLAEGLLDQTYFDRAWIFTVVRNPFDRTVSLFEYLRGRGDLPPTTSFSIFCQFIAQGAYEPLGLYNHMHLNQLNPQVAWLKDANGNMLPHFVGHYEKLAADAETVFTKLGCRGCSLQRLNPSNRRPLRDYYTDREVEVVRESYREDFVQFGYSMEPEFV